jgi:predicted DsbA family dithiol-disulfide isomerase
MSLSLELYIDHTCPYSYMAFDATRRVARKRGLPVDWRVLALAGGDLSLTPAEVAMHTQRQAADWPHIEALAAADFQLALTRPVWGADARTAAAAALWAARRSAQSGGSVHAAFFRAYFEEGRDIGEPTVLRELLRSAEVDPSGLDEALAASAMEAELARHAAAAQARGVTAVPALVAGSYLMVGAQPVDVLERSLDQVVRAAEEPGAQ